MSPRPATALVLLPLLITACLATTPTETAGVQTEVVSTSGRTPASTVNAHLYGSFRVGAAGGGSTTIVSGPANFPGAPKGGAGTCVYGTWVNAQGKATSGTFTRPHPHCVKPEAAIEIVLEPISACFSGFPNAFSCVGHTGQIIEERLWFGGSLLPYVVDGQHPGTDPTGGTATEWYGSNEAVVAYAVDAATLGTTNRRVGTLAINFSQYTVPGVDLFVNVDGSGTCVVGSAGVAYPCLNKVITATYQPLPAPDGLGPSDLMVEGFLWIQPAQNAFNYSDDPSASVYVMCRQQFIDNYGTPPNIFDIGSLGDAHSWCLGHVSAADVLDCAYRLAILAGVLGGSDGDPCLVQS